MTLVPQLVRGGFAPGSGFTPDGAVNPGGR
jgi:hypothetical protein